MRAALDHPRLWRMTAVLAALLLGGLVFVCAQGSLAVIAARPATLAQAAALPSWEPWCTRGAPRKERERLAVCGRGARRCDQRLPHRRDPPAQLGSDTVERHERRRDRPAVPRPRRPA